MKRCRSVDRSIDKIHLFLTFSFFCPFSSLKKERDRREKVSVERCLARRLLSSPWRVTCQQSALSLLLHFFSGLMSFKTAGKEKEERGNRGEDRDRDLVAISRKEQNFISHQVLSVSFFSSCARTNSPNQNQAHDGV